MKKALDDTMNLFEYMSENGIDGGSRLEVVKSFKILKKSNELRYNAGATYEADRVMKELPENLEAHKSREWIVMNLEAAREFFGMTFKKGFFG